MNKWIIIVFSAFLISGCASTQKTVKPEIIIPQQPKAEEEFEASSAPPELQNIKGEELEEYVEKKGVIFAKTEFKGLLETRYVRFLFEDLDDPKHKFHLHIGENTEQQTFPWEVKSVRPGYFFVELPVGRYKIASITIPVGSTTATESMDVTLEVLPGMVSYVGTLRMNGTKEKVRMGSLTDLPVIKPGFEFTVEVVDERDEGAEAFSSNYPDFPHGVQIKLMEINSLPSKENEPPKEATDAKDVNEEL